MSGPPVLITGCSSGFGLEASVELARRGWRVLATMRDLSRRAALDARAAAAGVQLEVLRLDVCDAPSINEAVSEVLARTGGRVDAVVHNAGIADAGFFEDMPDAGVRRVMETNFFGPLALTRAVLPAMRARGRGRIVVVSTIGAFTGSPAQSAYIASKWAVEGWAEALAMELAGFGIDVVLVEPGTYKTGIWAASTVARSPGSPYGPIIDRMEPRVRRTVERFGRDPAEVGRKIAEVLEAAHPSFRNPVGPDAWAAQVLGLLPFGLRRRLFQRMLRG